MTGDIDRAYIVMGIIHKRRMGRPMVLGTATYDRIASNGYDMQDFTRQDPKRPPYLTPGQ